MCIQPKRIGTGGSLSPYRNPPRDRVLRKCCSDHHMVYSTSSSPSVASRPQRFMLFTSIAIWSSVCEAQNVTTWTKEHILTLRAARQSSLGFVVSIVLKFDVAFYWRDTSLFVKLWPVILMSPSVLSPCQMSEINLTKN